MLALKRTGIIYDQRFLEHKTGIHHVEAPWRLESIFHMLRKNHLLDSLLNIPARLASIEEVESIHTSDYIDKIIDTANEPIHYLDPDTVTSEKTCVTAFLAVGSVLEAVKKVMQNRIVNAFALVRPPGHHAMKNRQMGFCIFNNIALAAKYAQKKFGLTKILIVDWDVHHPNSTQSVFESTPEILLFSTHRFPFFPGTGDFEEIGTGTGRGFTINVPLQANTGDAKYIEIYNRLLLPVALEYKPQLILVSAGFDAHLDDPIGGMALTENGFAAMANTVLKIAERTCNGHVVMVLEGGYDPSALRRSVKAVLNVMQNGSKETVQNETKAKEFIEEIIQKVIFQHKKYWKCLNQKRFPEITLPAA